MKLNHIHWMQNHIHRRQNHIRMKQIHIHMTQSHIHMKQDHVRRQQNHIHIHMKGYQLNCLDLVHSNHLLSQILHLHNYQFHRPQRGSLHHDHNLPPHHHTCCQSCSKSLHRHSQ